MTTKPHKATQRLISHAEIHFPQKMEKLELKKPQFRIVYNGTLVELIEISMRKHSHFDGDVNHMVLFGGLPTRFFLVPGSIEHAYYAILFTMAYDCVLCEHMLIQLSDEMLTMTMEFKTKYTDTEGTVHSTIMNHTKVFNMLKEFNQKKIGSISIRIMAYN